MTGVLKLLWALSGGPVVLWRLGTGGAIILTALRPSTERAGSVGGELVRRDY